jgi:hypothetical protein
LFEALNFETEPEIQFKVQIESGPEGKSEFMGFVNFISNVL